MSIEKKSLINTIQTTKKANVASSAHESTKFAAKLPNKQAVKLPTKMHKKVTKIAKLNKRPAV